MTSSAPWAVKVAPRAQKELRRLPTEEQKRIREVIDQLDRDPFAGDIRKISGETNVWRRRVGSYRIFFVPYPSVKALIIFRVERRTTSTY